MSVCVEGVVGTGVGIGLTRPGFEPMRLESSPPKTGDGRSSHSAIPSGPMESNVGGC